MTKAQGSSTASLGTQTDIASAYLVGALRCHGRPIAAIRDRALDLSFTVCISTIRSCCGDGHVRRLHRAAYGTLEPIASSSATVLESPRLHAIIKYLAGDYIQNTGNTLDSGAVCCWHSRMTFDRARLVTAESSPTALA